MNRYLVWLATCLSFFYGLHAQEFKEADVRHINLFPQQNQLRNLLNLSGIWQCSIDSLERGEQERWYEGLKESIPIAVPGSWNEQYEDIRNYMGMVWYEQNTFMPEGWRSQKIFLRFGSAHYAARVWFNGKPLGTHEGGHLPFAFEVTDYVTWGAPNKIVVQVENKLKPERVPPGGLPPGGMFNNYPATNYDFFPYGGLERPVWLYSVPVNYINDIAVKTSIENERGIVNLEIEKVGTIKQGKVKLEGEGRVFEVPVTFRGDKAQATVAVPGAHLWNLNDPFLYKLTVTLQEEKRVVDSYALDVGIRTVAVNNEHILLNGKPVFLKGFGKHEDFAVFGKGTANPVIVKDYSLLKWIGANSFRTAHYPYDEEYMNMADRQGILIIDEIPAVGLYFDKDLSLVNKRKEMCKQQIRELVARDKNHPSVIMWSLANEPIASRGNFNLGGRATADSVSMGFFRELFGLVRTLDNSRLSTIVGVQGGPDEWLGLSDVVCINRYYGWYTQNGNIDAGAKMLDNELERLYNALHKPIIVTEFGADTYSGMHDIQPEMFTEEYQRDFIKAYLDVAATKSFVTGMHVWAFADFKTAQGVIRFGGMNWKGVFTRDRKPKAAAFYLRSRWAKPGL